MAVSNSTPLRSMDRRTANERPPLILVVDDQEWSARAFESVLNPRGYSVIRCRSARQTLDHIQTISPDALLIKADLRDMPSIDLCRALRIYSHVGPTTPIFLATAAPLRRAQRLEALRAGVWDLISLPMDAEEFLARLDTFVGSKFEADHARDQSLLDQSSGLYSVQGLLRIVKELSLDAYRHQSPIACAVIGPESEPEDPMAKTPALSNEVSAQLVSLMIKMGRGSDAIGRLTDTEFVVVAPRTTSDGVLKLARRFQDAALERDVNLEGNGLRLRVGCYAVENFKEGMVEPSEILVRATMALRRAQRDTAAPAICFFGQQPYSVQ